jgi:fluoroquinolone transport system permease protein
MTGYRAMIRNDIRQLAKDPLLMGSLLGSLAVVAFARYGFPLLAAWVERRYAFELSVYADFAAFFLLTVIPLLTGIMTGLLMLDERDENLIAYYGVTPLTRRGYYRYRLALPSLLAVLASGLYMLASGLVEVRMESLYVLLLTALEAPCIALFLATAAANKVEGLALAKMCGLLFVGPVIVSFVPKPWQLAGIVVPTYWPAKSYMLGEALQPVGAALSFAVGLAYHLLLLKVAARAFAKRMD